MQAQFIKHLKDKVKNNVSLVEEVSNVLDIGYDAAYRRVTLKTNLTLEEGILLAKYYNISINNFFEIGSQNTLLVEKSPPINNLTNLELYFERSITNLFPLIKLKDASIIYSAKDIPLFHTLRHLHLTYFKLFIWVKFNNKEMIKNKMTLEEFIVRIPKSLLEKAQKLSYAYNNINITEFWNDNTINCHLEQIKYLYESQLLSKDMSLKICNDLQHIVEDIEKQTIQQSIIDSKTNTSYNLYKSNLLTMSNIIMVKARDMKTFFIPFTVLEYFKVQDQKTCDEMYNFFERQKTSSKHLAHTGEKDRNLFFNKMRHKISKLQIHVNSMSSSFDFD